MTVDLADVQAHANSAVRWLAGEDAASAPEVLRVAWTLVADDVPALLEEIAELREHVASCPRRGELVAAVGPTATNRRRRTGDASA